MSRQSLVAMGAPALFVFLWSTGFISAKLALPHIEPMTFLGLRFAVVALGFLGLVLWLGLRWPSPVAMLHQLVAGLLLHAVYLGGVFVAIAQGVEAGASALVVGLQPLLVAAVAAPFLGEAVGWRQWLGLVLGILGVGLVVAEKLGAGMGTAVGVAFATAALLGITLGTLYQKRYARAASTSGSATSSSSPLRPSPAVPRPWPSRPGGSTGSRRSSWRCSGPSSCSPSGPSRCSSG